MSDISEQIERPKGSALLTPRKIKQIAQTSMLPHMHRSSGCDLSPFLKLAAFEKMAPELHRMTDEKWGFSEEEAVKEIVRCLEHPNGIKLVVERLMQYHLLEKNNVEQERWKQLLTAVFLSPACKQPLYLFLKRAENQKRMDEMPTMDVAAILIDTLSKRPDSDELIRHALSDYTQYELSYYSDPVLAFRFGTLSSYLHAKYCTFLLQDLFAQLSAILSECNAECFEDLAPVFLSNLYRFPLPASCGQLLSTRRGQLYEFLLKTHAPKEAEHLSGILIGETLFLRVINPFLLNNHKDSIPLMKIAQALSDQVPFGAEKPHSLPPAFDKIYDAFIKTHIDYINRYFVLEDGKRMGDFFSIEE